MSKSIQENKCFDANTKIMYRTEMNGNIIVENIKDAYKKHNGDTIYVPAVDAAQADETAVLFWEPATLCNTKTSQCVTVILTKENYDVFHVTPNHQFVIRTENGSKLKHAYLLESKDEILFDAGRLYDEQETPLFLEDGEIAIEDLYEDGSNQNTVFKKVSKAITNNADEGIIWDFYGIVLENDNEKKYVLIHNGLLSHDSTITKY